MTLTIKSISLAAGLAAVTMISGCGGGDNDTVAPPTGGQSSPAFVFDPTPADSPLYLRVDRTGAPAVATALLSKATTVTITGVGGAILNPATAANAFNDQRDQLNRGDPVNDARDFAAVFVAGPQSNSLKNIHFKIANELRSLGLTPCSTTPGAVTAADVNVDACVAQAAPVIIPDVIIYDFQAPAGFPNGRSYDDPVADRLLTAALLRISPVGGAPAPHNLNTLVGVRDTWNGPVGAGCVAPGQVTGDESNVISPTTFPFLRPAYPP
jgi:hypothetical protein